MEYITPKLDITKFDCNIGTQSMSQIHGEGNTATQALEESSKYSVGEADAQIFKFSWE